MIDYAEVYIYSDQPTTCPFCGVRSDIIFDLSHTIHQTQVHHCKNEKCEFEFVVEGQKEIKK
jgi:hypothetical protein